MNSEQPLLSICIPTYNRAAYLQGALINLIMDPAFDNRLEVVISDNCSTDNTRMIAEAFANQYPNIHYYRNEVNVHDRNFEIGLKHCKGEYLKLSNDTLRYHPGTLKKFYDGIEKFKDKEGGLMFFELAEDTTANSKEELIDLTGALIGWIGCFGLWRSDLECLNVERKFYDYKFPHVAWILEIMKKHGKINLCGGGFYHVLDPKKKGSYNFFDVQVSNMFKILRDYGVKGISYEKAKYKFFKNTYLCFIRKYIFQRYPATFDFSHYRRTFLKEYWCRPYFFPMLAIVRLKFLMGKYDHLDKYD